MRVLAIDPGSTESAYILFNGTLPAIEMGIVDNGYLLGRIPDLLLTPSLRPDVVYIEGMQSYGTVMGKSTIDTLVWIGRFQQQYINYCEKWNYAQNLKIVLRTSVKSYVCGTTQAKDGHVREALIDRYGPQGTKKAQGKTYGISSHIWSALAIGTYAISKESVA